jgi:predicted deacetylase
MKKHRKRSLVIILLIVLLVLVVYSFVILLIFRHYSSKTLDDVSPQRYCSKELIGKSDILFVIPLLGNVSIANNQSWCKEMLSLNKTIGMHGVYHVPDNPGEFSIDRDKEYIQTGMEEFNKCFGFYPSLFKAPQLRLSQHNKMLLKELNMTFLSVPQTIFYKEYHCTDLEEKSYLSSLNKIFSWF